MSLSKDQLNHKLVSVIIPLYNVEKYLSVCLDSILSQSYSDLECILVDDGSQDTSGKICDYYANKDQRVKVIHKENEGVSVARNRGLEICSGEYISFVDSDDYIDHYFLENLVRIANQSSSDIVSCDFVRVEKNDHTHFQPDKKTPIDSIRSFTSKEACEMLYNVLHFTSGGGGIHFIVCDKLFKRALFEKICFEKGRALEDVLILPKLFFNASKITYINYTGYAYRKTPNSIISHGVSVKKFLDSMYVYQENIEFFATVKQIELKEHAEAMLCSSIVNWHIKIKHQKNREKRIYSIYLKESKKILKKYQKAFLRNQYISSSMKCMVTLGRYFSPRLFYLYSVKK